MTSRLAADRCPGVLRPYQAVDGGVLRIRIPDGDLVVTPWRGVTACPDTRCARGAGERRGGVQ